MMKTFLIDLLPLRKPYCPYFDKLSTGQTLVHSSRCTRLMQEGKKTHQETLKDSASSAENNFQNYNYKTLPTQICQRSKQINLPTEN
jgi:hypothetical protein